VSLKSCIHSRALSATQDVKLIAETLEITATKTRDQDVLQFFTALSKNYKARRILTKYIEDHYDEVRGLLRHAEFSRCKLFLNQILERFETGFVLGEIFSVRNEFKDRS